MQVQVRVFVAFGSFWGIDKSDKLYSLDFGRLREVVAKPSKLSSRLILEVGTERRERLVTVI